MPVFTTQNSLGAEGTIVFSLTPVENDTDRLFLIDIGAEETRDRISLVATHGTEGNKMIKLEAYNSDGVELPSKEVSFPQFQLGSIMTIELVWSSSENKIAVFMGNEEILVLEDQKIQFENLGQVIHHGEDINGEHQTQMDVDVSTSFIEGDDTTGPPLSGEGKRIAGEGGGSSEVMSE